MATYSVFGVMGPGLFGFGVGLAMDRERGLLTLKRVQPVPASALLLAQVAHGDDLRCVHRRDAADRWRIALGGVDLDAIAGRTAAVRGRAGRDAVLRARPVDRHAGQRQCARRRW